MSPRNEEQNAMIKDERREQILSAALKVFATRGFAATKISDIVAKGGMSHGLVYHYFKSKEEIFFELISRAVNVAAESLRMVDSLPMPPLEKVRQTAVNILNGIDEGEDSSYYFMIVVHAALIDLEDKEKYLVGSDVPVHTLVKILKQGQETGVIKDGDPLEMAIMFFAAIQGVAIYKLSMPFFKLPDPELLVSMVKK